MILLSDEEQINGKYTSVALGVFDGVHRGHKAVIDAAAENAAANDLSFQDCNGGYQGHRLSSHLP